MKNLCLLTVSLAIVLLVGATAAYAANFTDKVSYQGRLTDAEGVPVPTGSYPATFGIFRQLSGGTAIWEESRTVSVKDSGLFSIDLGAVVPLTPDVFADADNPEEDCIRYLEVVFQGEAISPRTLLMSVPFAQVAARLFGEVVIGDNDMTIVDTTGDTAQSVLVGVDDEGNAGISATTVDGGDTCSQVSMSSFRDGASLNLSADTTGDTVVSIVAGVDEAASIGLTTASQAKAGDTLSWVRIISDRNGASIELSGGSPVAPDLGFAADNSGGRMALLDAATGDTLFLVSETGHVWSSAAIETGTGFIFPDATVQTTAAGGGNWAVTDSVLYTSDYWGIARGGAANVLFGDSAHTMVNLGTICTTGTAGYTQEYMSIGGGYGNSAVGSYSAVGGGNGNCAAGDRNTIAGGESNYTSSSFTAIGGGYINNASNPYATVSGGSGNAVTSAYGSIGGGESNEVTAEGATIGGGRENLASAIDAAIGGGISNTASGEWGSTVSGGLSNTASHKWTTVSGGSYNSATSIHSSVGGGRENLASGYASVVSGGYQNSADGYCSAIPGGVGDTIGQMGAYSMVFGDSVYVNTSKRVVFFDGAHPGRLGVNRDDHEGGIDYPIHVGTDTGNGNGAHLTNGGTWTNGSSRSFKENFQALDGKELLSRISSIPVESWNYRGSDEKHIGPVAEDFVAAFDVGTIRKDDGQRENRYLATSDVAGVTLAAVKVLHERNQELEAEVARLKAQLEKLLEQNR